MHNTYTYTHKKNPQIFSQESMLLALYYDLPSFRIILCDTPYIVAMVLCIFPLFKGGRKRTLSMTLLSTQNVSSTEFTRKVFVDITVLICIYFEVYSGVG